MNSNMPSIIDFAFNRYTIRTMFDTETNTGYVCLADLLKAMGSTTGPRHILPELEEMFGDGSKIVTPIPDALGRIQETVFVSEHAALFVISRGRTNVSKHLNRWLFGEVLPALRKTGTYTMPGAGPSFQIPKTYAEALRLAAEQAEKLDVQNRIIIQQEAELLAQAPKLSAYKHLMDSSVALDATDGMFTFKARPRDRR